MIIQQLKGDNGRPVINHFVIASAKYNAFQSYDTVICADIFMANAVYLDRNWKVSATTSRHRATFLGETTAETQAKLDNGEYKLVDNLSTFLDNL